MKSEIKLGFQDYTALVFIPDPASTDGSGKTGLVAANLTVSYTRVETDNDVTVTDATSSLNNLATLTTAHADWGLLEVSNTLAPGLYRLDIADAVFAAGAWTAVVYVMITTSAAAASPMEFILVAFDPLDATRMGLAALPNAAADAAGGLPISDAGGLDLDSKLANTNEITVARMGALTDWINGGRLDLILDDILLDTGTTLDDLVDDLESRLTAARAGYLDNLSAGAVALEATAQTILTDTNELQTDWVNGGRLDLIIDAIKAKTDQITFTTANKIDATIQVAGDFAQAAADKVWSTASRTLTAFGFSVTVGTNSDKTGYTLSAAGVQAIWDALTSALTAVGSIGKLLVDNINATISSRSSHSAADVWSVATRILTAGTNIVLAKGTGVTGFNDLSAAQVNTEADTALTDYDAPTSAELVTEINSIQTDIAALNNLSAAQVNTEVVDALNVDTYAEIGQEAPAATQTIRKMVAYLYKAWRNRSTQTSSAYKLYADDATTVDHKSTVSDDNVTFDRGEIGTGP